MTKAPYTIVVNSTDSFEDCWLPFFTLFSKYWPDCEHPIVLNTETKSFSYPGLNIQCSKVQVPSSTRRLSWSECLMRCLDTLNTDLILYLQEDYFLNAPVDVSSLELLTDIMNVEGFSHISLVTFSNSGPWHSTSYPFLWEVGQRADYRLSLQAGLWRRDRLRSYLRSHETPWQFEVWGSKRARRVRDTILCVSHEIFGNQIPEVIPYKATGIVKGKWNREAVCGLFDEQNICVDFSVRGFYDQASETRERAPLIRRALARLRSTL